ncbi:PAS domain S-box protein [Tumebacillus permanentifrigoris]|uniref:histidine kinase n=1 Tax=Tumebacillus permanentifrigoris TaxID=378543 RepID=A0A316D5K2_9BACL|nr:PAS domain S-box protein [Tumebacillus permanentifrigoris]PWK06289.1 two-component system sporulation sensor kinase A [Tumebacillus permanentifrigoris]
MREQLNKDTELDTRMVPIRSLTVYMMLWGVGVVLFHEAFFWMTGRDILLTKLSLGADLCFGLISGLIVYGLLGRQAIEIKRLKVALQQSEDKFSEYMEEKRDDMVLERSLTKRVFEESEQRYRSLFENHPDMVFSCDLEGNFIEANPMCVAISGFTLNDAMHQSILPFIAPEDAQEVHSRFLRTVQGEAQHYRCRIVHREGHYLYLDVTNLPIVVDDQIVGVYGIAKDISEEVRAHEEFVKTKEHLESFISNTTDAIYLIDHEGIVIRVNAAFERIYGWSAEEIVGQPFDLLIPSECEAEVQELRRRLAQDNHLTDYETVRVRKDGTRIDVSITVSIISDANGEFSLLAGIGREITERKRVETALREIESLHRLITEHTTDIIALYDNDFVLQYVSPSVKEIFGIDAEDYIGRYNVDQVHPEDHQLVVESLALLYQSKEPMQREYRQLHVDGHYVWIDMKGMPVFDALGDVMGIVVIGRDITERRRAEELLRKSDKLAVVGQLAAGVAHEIRNPLTSIKGFAQLLKGRFAEIDHYFDIMLSELDRIEFIMNEFLVLAKPQAVTYGRAELRDLLGDITALIETQAIINNVQIFTEFADDLPPITCEVNRLKQVFVNILKNAIEAMPDGGDLMILTEREGEDAVRVRVLDTGCGIHPDRIPKLGEPFYTTKERGTGLGLMVSSKIVKDHKGDIRFHSRMGQGTSVEVVLPISHDSRNVLSVGDVG